MLRSLFAISCVLFAALAIVPVFAQSTIHLPIVSEGEPPIVASSTNTPTPSATPSHPPTPTLTPTVTPCATIAGVISVATTLSSGCSYNVTKNVLVSEGITLSVPASVTLRFNPSIYMMVDGSLIVSGTIDAPSRFTRNSLGMWGGVRITEKSGHSSSLNYMTLEYARGEAVGDFHTALYAKNARPVLSNITFQYNSSAFRIFGPDFTEVEPLMLTGGAVISNTDASLLHYNSVIDGVLFSGNTGSIVLLMCRGGVIQNNTFIDNAALVLRIARCNPDAVFSIRNNIIGGNSGAIDIQQAFSVTIESNEIYDNGTAWHQESLLPMDASIYLPCSTTLAANNIYSNTALYAVRTRPGDCDIDAANNYWGTTIASEIDAMIYDYDDDFTLGKINYEPFSLAPN